MRRNISNRGRAVFCNSRDMDSSVASLLLMFMVVLVVVVDDDECDFCLASSEIWREVNAVIVTMNISLGVISCLFSAVVPLRRRCSSIAVSINAEQQAALRTLEGSRAGPTVRISVSIFWKFCATSSGVSWAREYSESEMDEPPERKVPNPSDELADDDIDEERTLLLIMEALLPDRERVII